MQTRVWKNAPPTLRDALLASPRTRDASSLSMKMIARRSRTSIARSPRLRMNCKHKASARAIASRSSCAICRNGRSCFLRRALIGAIITPLNAWWTGPELEYGLIDSGAKIAFLDAERYERLVEHLPIAAARTRVYVCRERRRARRSPRDASLEHCAWQRQRLGQVAGSLSCPMSSSDPTTMRRSSTPRARPVNRRARSARIATTPRAS